MNCIEKLSFIHTQFKILGYTILNKGIQFLFI